MSSFDQEQSILQEEIKKKMERLATLREKKKTKQKVIMKQFFPARIQMLETSKHKLSQELQSKTRKLEQKQRENSDMVSLLQHMKRGAELKKKQTLTVQEEQEWKQIQQYIKEKQQDLFYKIPRGQVDILKMAMKTYRTDIHTKKFPNNYYQFLVKQMLNPKVNTALEVIDRFYTESHQGLALESLWTILISLGFCHVFSRQDYDFYDAELKNPTDSTPSYFITKIVSNADYLQFLKTTRIKGVNGKSDITLRRKHDGKWIFISCKYYKHEHGDYDIPAIFHSIQKTNERNDLIGNNYKIYVFANNQEKAQSVLKSSRVLQDKDIQKHIQTNGDYHVLGMEQLETCFARFKEAVREMSIEHFERVFLKRYYQLSSLHLTLGQMPLVNTTYRLILENKKKCNAPDHLSIYWNTIPQFGKTYCVGMLFLKLVKLFNAVIVVDTIEMLRNYTRNVFGGHEQFVVHFNVFEITTETTVEKLHRKLAKSSNKNNILVVLRKHLDVVYGIPHLHYIVFDELDDNSMVEFDKFTSSPNRIGLFLTSITMNSGLPTKQKTTSSPVCNHVLQWTFQDQQVLRQIVKRLAQMEQQSEHEQQEQQHQQEQRQQTEQERAIRERLERREKRARQRERRERAETRRRQQQSLFSLLQNHPYRHSLHTSLSRKATSQDLGRCLDNSLDLSIVSHYHTPTTINFTDLFKLVTKMSTRSTLSDGSNVFQNKEQVDELLNKIQNVLEQYGHGQHDETFHTQLWFLPFTNNTKISQKLRLLLRQHPFFKKFSVVIRKEDDNKANPDRNPAPLKDKFGQLVQHFQTRAHSDKKKGLIVLLDPKADIRGIPLPNVDFVFSLNNEQNMELVYLMMSKCLTPHHDKQSVYFVDFNTKRVMSLLKEYFGMEIVHKKMVRLVDVEHPEWTVEQIKQQTPAPAPSTREKRRRRPKPVETIEEQDEFESVKIAIEPEQQQAIQQPQTFVLTSLKPSDIRSYNKQRLVKIAQENRIPSYRQLKVKQLKQKLLQLRKTLLSESLQSLQSKQK